MPASAKMGPSTSQSQKSVDPFSDACQEAFFVSKIESTKDCQFFSASASSESLSKVTYSSPQRETLGLNPSARGAMLESSTSAMGMPSYSFGSKANV